MHLRALLLALFLFVAPGALVSAAEPEARADVPITEVMRLIREGNVSEVLVRNQGGFPRIVATMKDGTQRYSYLPFPRLPDEVLLSGVTVRADNGGAVSEGLSFVGAFISIVMAALMATVVVMLIRQLMSGVARSGKTVAKAGRVRFDDVAGQEAAKHELEEVVDFLKDPGRFKSVGARAPRGVLLSGPPGNGKTLLARAVAGQASVPFFHVDAPEILEMFAGLGARRIRAVFKKCRKSAPCILFIDEIDSIGGRRSAGGSRSDAQGEREQILNQLLVEMDGAGRSGQIVVIAATNRSDTLDPALIRPGRFDRNISVGRPDLNGREAILKVHSKGVKLAPDLALREVARMTTGFSGAEVANLVNEAAICAGRAQAKEVKLAHFAEARDRMLMGATRPSGVMSEEERTIAAWHEAGHAVAAVMSPHSDPVAKATIIPRGMSLGAVLRLPDRDRALLTLPKIEADLLVAMAGRAAEQIRFGFGFVTNGASSDIAHATLLAREAVGRWGMSSAMGSMDYLGAVDGSGAASPETLAVLDTEVRAVVDRATDAARALLTRELELLRYVAERLLEVETLDGEDIRRMAAERGIVPTGTPAAA